jgi:hypothetical protein
MVIVLAIGLTVRGLKRDWTSLSHNRSSTGPNKVVAPKIEHEGGNISSFRNVGFFRNIRR